MEQLANKATSENPTTANLGLSTPGSDWDWAVFAVMLFSNLILIGWTYTRPRGTRLFNYLGIIILTTSTLAYFIMAANLGQTPIAVQYLRGRAPGTTRAIWYVRYIDWFITTPLLLLMLLLATGLNVASLLLIIFMDMVMVVMLLVGALTHSAYKWGFYAFALAALVFIWSSLLFQGWRAAKFIGPDASVHYIRGAAYLSFIWMIYPICWALSEGGNVITVTGEHIFYGVLDLLSRPVFVFLMLWSMRNIEYDRFGLTSFKASESSAPGAVETGRGMTGTGTGTGTGVTTGQHGATTGQHGNTTGATGTTNATTAPGTAAGVGH
ncbi:heat shock protein 30 [Hysterangium stoloniferum]|nr:heat shock protein 30 [Hysterangium stoloniferum]